MRHLLGGILALSLTAIVLAAPPMATHLYPAGAARGTTVEIAVGGTFDTWPVAVWSSHPGVTVTPGKEKGTLRVQVAANVEPGIAWIRLHNAEGAASLRPFIVGSLPEIEEKETNDEPDRAMKITQPTCVVNGRLGKPGDVDCFAVALKKGQPLVASLLAQRVLKSPLDAILQVTTTDGFVLAQSHDVFDLDPHAVFTAPADAAYIVRLFAFPSQPDSSIRFMGAETYVYRLTLATTGFIDHAWPLAIPRDAASPVEFVGPGIPSGKGRREIPPGGEERADLGLPEYAGSADVRREPHPCLLVEQVREAMPPFTVSARIDRPGQVVSIPFRASKGKPLQIQAEVARLGSSVTPLLVVRDAEGKQLSRAEPKSPAQDVEIAFAPPADGLYRLDVSDLYRAGQERGWVRIRIVPPEPTVSLTLPADRIVLAADKPTEVTVAILRKGGFKGEIDWKVDCPPGITAEPVKPAPADGKSQVLRFTPEKDATGGPVRIVGVSPALGRPQPVEATVADLGTTTQYLWLTRGAVPPPTKKKR